MRKAKNIDTRICYYCKSENRKFYAKENGYTLVKCTGCGLLYLASRPDDKEISEAHQQGKHSGEQMLDVTGKFVSYKVDGYVKVLNDLFESPVVKKTWLDVGCGHGEFITAIQQYSDSIIVKGTEPNIHKVEAAKKRGLDVSFFELATHSEKYDVISLLNVYSHLSNPPEFLSLLKSLLNPNGEIIMETGDSCHLTADENYRPFYLPDHLSFASEDIVTGILTNLGFDIVKVRKYPYLKKSFKGLLAEAVKAILPQYQSNIRCYLNWSRYSQTDMYIRAKKTNYTNLNIKCRI